MEHIYAVESSDELERYKAFVSNHQAILDQYIAYIRSELQVDVLPQCIVWTSRKTATSRISNIPIPAYTNDYRIVMCPDVQDWKQIYIKQLDGLSAPPISEIRNYYESELNPHHILQILGHELAHHSEYFIDALYDSNEGIWFEEGMAEYISRKFFLTESEFHQEMEINKKLVSLYLNNHAPKELDNFDSSTYNNSYASIFYAYWQSFLAVYQIVEKHQGNITSVFQSYQQWYPKRDTCTLAQWFEIED